VTKALFDHVQEVLTRKTKPQPTGLKPYLYRGMFRCGGCGAFITTETQKGHHYMHCTRRVKRDCTEPWFREELISEQITRYLAAISLPPEIAVHLLTELEEERATSTVSRNEAKQTLEMAGEKLDEKFDRLMNVYLDKAITLPEYTAARNKLVHEKQELKDKLAALDANRGDWFEPAIRFVQAAKSGVSIAENGTAEEKREFLKNVGSNLTISNRYLSVQPRGAWKLVVDQGSFAHQTTAPRFGGAVVVGETHACLNKRRR
jgi:hypothetical protein